MLVLPPITGADTGVESDPGFWFQAFYRVMEVVGVTASFAGLLSLTTVVIQSGYAYVQVARKWENEVRAITNEVIHLSGLLHTLRPLIDDLSLWDNESKNNQHPQRPEGTKHKILFANEIHACNSTLTEIKIILEKSTRQSGSVFGNVSRRLLWPLKKTDVMPFLERLERHKAAFDLSLCVYQTYLEQPHNLKLTLISHLLSRETRAAISERRSAEDERGLIRDDRKGIILPESN